MTSQMSFDPGLSAFPLAPVNNNQLDFRSYCAQIERIAVAGVHSITVLGSASCYPYFEAGEREALIRLGVENAGDVPVYAGIGAMRTIDVLRYAHTAQEAGASALLLAPLNYHPLTQHEVLRLFTDVDAEVGVPIIVYDNPRTTRFEFSPELIRDITALDHVAAVKIPGVGSSVAEAKTRVDQLRELCPPDVILGISGDWFARDFLLGGADAWFAGIAGVVPEFSMRYLRLLEKLRHEGLPEGYVDPYKDLWDFVIEHGSLRAHAAISECLGMSPPDSLPRPILSLDAAARVRIRNILDAYQITG